MNATTQAKTRNVYVRDIMMPVVFCKDCKYSSSNGLYGCYLEHFELAKDHMGRLIPNNGARMYAEDFCSRGVRRGEEDEID